MKESVVITKSRNFSKQIIHLYRVLCLEQKEFIMSKQLLRCGTSIGANLAEATCAISKKDFFSKNYIAFKECAECDYWLNLLWDSEYMPKERFATIREDCAELQRLLSSITHTLRKDLPPEDYGY